MGSITQQVYGFPFTTKNGNHYYYDDISGKVYPDSIAIEEVDPKRQIPFKDNDPILDTLISTYLDRESGKQLTLVVTEDCNLRCRYCAYSGQYPLNRVHKQQEMTWDVAKTAVDQYVTSFCTAKQYNPSMEPAIGFYGGEPLLNYPLIQQVVSYANNVFNQKVIFYITTNGTLLSEDIIKYFINNDFHMLVSVNGDREEHDRLRVSKEGLGTYNTIWRNMQKVRRIDCDYYNNNCHMSIVYDTGTDLTRLIQFFEKRRQLLPQIGVVSPVSWLFTEWYNRYSTVDQQKYNASYESLVEALNKAIRTGVKVDPIINHICGRGYYHIMTRTQSVPPGRDLVPFTSTCIPGKKLTVYGDGSFHTCERINSHFPIGDIKTGLDKGKIKLMLLDYYKQIFPVCLNCRITRLCTVCFAVVGGEGVFTRSPSDLCDQELKHKIQSFINVWDLLEDNVPEDVITNMSPSNRAWYFEL